MSCKQLSKLSISTPVFTRRAAGLGVAASFLCGFQGRQQSPAKIEFTRIPKADSVGLDKQDIIEGTAPGARPDQQIVLYAKSGKWWLQPLVSSPFTRIQKDAKWRNATHLGTDYAALLVEPGYEPLAVVDTIPSQGGAVSAVAVTKGADVSPSVLIQFSGYEWRVRDARSNRGGRSNPYSPENVRVDKTGAMHLRVKKIAKEWSCAEMALTRSFGYGTYSFVVRDISGLAANFVFEMFTWDYSGSDGTNREMDIVFRRSPDSLANNARYIVQPFHVSANVSGFMAPAGLLTHSFKWEPGRITFRTFAGSSRARAKHAIAGHVFTLGIPAPGMETARIAFYVPSVATPLSEEAEVVVDRFQYLP